VGRDPERTPMQWDDSPNAGFAPEGVTPWLPLAADYREPNVTRQNAEPTSMLNLYRELASLRQTEPALSVGEYVGVETAVSDILAYQRTAPNADSFLVALNFSSTEHVVNLSHVAPQAAIAVASDGQKTGSVDLRRLSVGPD